MRRTLGYVALGLVAYLIFAAATLPAKKALGFAFSQLQPQGVALTASGITGSAWSGRVASLTVNGFGFQQVGWELNPLSLAGGRIGGDWNVTWQGARLQGYGSTAPDGRFLLEDVEAHSPAAEFAGLLPIPVTLGGDIRLNLRRLELEGGHPVTAEGDLLWKGAALVAPLEASLGDLRLVLKPLKDGGTDARISDEGGPLRVEGELKVDPNGAYRIDALLGTRPGADPALEESLPLIGRRAPDGRYRVVYQGKF